MASDLFYSKPIDDTTLFQCFVSSDKYIPVTMELINRLRAYYPEYSDVDSLMQYLSNMGIPFFHTLKDHTLIINSKSLQRHILEIFNEQFVLDTTATELYKDKQLKRYNAGNDH